ncbi:uncharacterized protein K02A2.6-like [Toxorhynchites rutilus septentrionalis]|uniref:uncharacterized protein K02A2.6-like n=1 Tax=Toxorhynchites rutilus septentrionalis TaxID=329112 RepID=UPI0024786656|nr:uncharacterized protein K02A2.6-like [Toxorhynchites rutilus septentrionalis]
MNLDELTNYAVNREVLAKQKEKLHPFGIEPNATAIAYVKQEPSTSGKSTFNNGRALMRNRRTDIECSRCGSWKHREDSRDCFARSARCNGCGRVGHFARKCRTQDQVNHSGPLARRSWKRSSKTNAVREENHPREEHIRYAESGETREGDASNSGMITCKIDCFPVDFLIDSGATINTVTEQVWNVLAANGITLYKKKFNCDRRVTAYASQAPLEVLVMFEAWTSVNDTKPKAYAEFFVIQGACKSLLSKRTAEDLKVLKVGLVVNSITLKSDAFPKFPNVQIKLSIDKSIPPKKLAYLRIPAAMEEKVDMKIQQMLDNDVIEQAIGPPEWISPMVVVPKGKNDIRLCINMKLPNQAIQREHYPLPMIDTLLNKLKGSTYFTKLDITSAFHHIELHPESRGITTFMTNRGLMRFKRLMCINCAPEIFQRVMCDMLAGVEGVIVYIDDIVVAGKTKEQHDARLEEVLSILRENNATLNKEKCLIGVKQLEILGYKVSPAGISPSEDKISVIRDFRQPETKDESEAEEPFDDDSEHYLCAIEDRLAAITLDEIRNETAKDETLIAVIEAIHSQLWPPGLFHYQPFSKELGLIDDVLVREDRIILPVNLRTRALDIAHRGHPGVVTNPS